MARCTPIGSKSMRHPAARHVDLRLAVAVVLVALAIACGRSDPPRLEVTPLPANGTTNSGDLRYQLRNVGGRTLALDGLASTCGCAAITQLPETLAPGAASVLAVQCRPVRAVGEVVRELRLRSSDPSNPETVLRITQPGGDAGPDPAALYFGYVAVGESAVRDVVLPVAVSAASVMLPAQSELRVEPMPARADGAHGVRVVFTPRLAGVVRATVDLGPAGGVLPVIAIGYAGVLAFPAEVRLTRSAGPPNITLIGLGDEPLAITDIDYPPGLAGELRTVVPGRQFRLVLRGRGTAGAAGEAAIRLRREGGDPILIIPVVGTEIGDLAPTA